MGIEPTYPAWKAGVLPLNYTRRCPVPESNQRHKDFQSFALPTELTGLVAHNKDYFKGRNLCCQAKMKIINKEEYLHSSSAVPLRHSRPEHNSHGDCEVHPRQRFQRWNRYSRNPSDVFSQALTCGRHLRQQRRSGGSLSYRH